MSKLDVETRAELMTVVKKAIIDMIDSYLNIDECNLDMKEFGILKKAFDSLCDDSPLDNESRVYLKTLAGDKLGDGLNVLRDKVDDNPKFRSDVDELLTWLHVVRDI